MRVVSLEQTTEQPKLKLMQYGDSGSGKTHLIGTAMLDERTAPVLVLNARGQPISLSHLDPPPLVLDVETMKDFNLPYQWIMAGQPWDAVEIGTNKGNPFFMAVWHYARRGMGPPSATEINPLSVPVKFQTVAVDSITQVQRIAMNEILGVTSPLPVPETMARAQIQHWGTVLTQMTRLADLYFQLPIHVIITALRRKQMIENLGIMMFSPFVWGQARMEIPSHAEVVGMLVNIESLRAQQVTALGKAHAAEFAGAWNVLLTRGGRTFIAKWQGLRKPPAEIVAPTIGKLMDILVSG